LVSESTWKRSSRSHWPCLVRILWNFFSSLTTNLEYHIKSNYKTTSTTSCVNRETNLTRPLTAWLENDYCSITVANHQLISASRFITKSYTHRWKDFANRLHLVFHAEVRCFVKSWQDRLPNTALVSGASMTKCFHPGPDAEPVSAWHHNFYS